MNLLNRFRKGGRQEGDAPESKAAPAGEEGTPKVQDLFEDGGVMLSWLATASESEWRRPRDHDEVVFDYKPTPADGGAAHGRPAPREHLALEYTLASGDAERLGLLPRRIL